MEQQFDLEVLLKLKQKKRRQAWKRILSVMMCVVVFCTTYMLILPAITKEAKVFCGKEEHTHSEKCYNVSTELICTETESISKTLICGIEETAGHIHTENCGAVTERVLSCGLAETEGHIHAESCSATQTVLSCALAESEEHLHGESCYSISTSLVCAMEESQGHTHGETCYTTVTTYGCGLEENPAAHTHTDACYAAQTENGETGHQHTDACYARELICQVQEHTHSLVCFADPTADLESAAGWKKTLPQLTDIYRQDVLAIANSQLGYTESTRNYVVDEDGSTRGYTRYGAWYGNPYGDWCAMFASFCLHYAGLEDYPHHAGCPSWVNLLREKDLYRLPSEYIPKAGDIIFFDYQQNNSADHVGLVAEVIGTDVITIEGNSGNRVTKNKYELFDKRIAGYGVLVDTKTMKEQVIAPEQTDAWAVLIGPDSGAKNVMLPTVSKVAPTLAAAGDQGASSGIYVNGARAYEALDLTPYINAVNMYDEDGKLIPSGSMVSEGDLIEFKIEYTITGQQLAVMNGETITVKTDTLAYTMPGLVEIVESSEGDIVNSAGQIVGAYTIDSTSGTITMRFSESYVEQNAGGMQIHGFISCFSTVTKITENDKENQDYEFKDGITLGIVIEEKNEIEGDLSIEKQKTDIDGEYITYEVIVTSDEGTNGPITITDEMSHGLTFVQGLEVRNSSGSLVNNASFNAASDGKSFTMTLPELAPGGRYTVRYRCKADINLLGADMTVRNTATVNGKNSDGKEIEDKVTVDHTFDVLKKTGVSNGDGSITWTITVNQAKADISGWELEDIIGGNQSYTGPVTISDSRGNVLAQNVKLPYTFPNGSKDTYVITYTTTHDFGDAETIYNKAILKDDDTDVTVVTGVGIGTPFEKSGEIGELIQDAQGNNLLPITWTVTIDTSRGPIPAGKELYDKMNGSYHTADMYLTYDQLMATIAAIEAELTRVGSSISYAAAESFEPGYGVGGYYNLDKLKNDPACKDLLYERFGIVLGKEIPKGQVLTFSYVGYGIFPNNLVEETVFKNRFSLANEYEIEASVKYTSGKVKATKYGMKPYDPNSTANQDWALDWNLPHPSRYDYSQLHDSYLAWAIELSIPPTYSNNDDIVIYEDLPDGVTVKGLDLPFLLDAPTKRLKMRDMVPGETYDWTFMLYPPDQYIIDERYREGGTETSIVVKVTTDGDLEITIPGEVFNTMARFITYYNGLGWGASFDESYGYLYIYTQIDEDYKWTPETEGSYVYVDTFENRLTVTNQDGDVIDIGSQSQIITRDETDGVIRKEGNVDSNNIITYSVVLNAYGRDLIENSGVLAIHDELTYTSTAEQPLRLRLVPGSVKLFEVKMNSNGTYKKGDEVTANYRYNEVSSEQGANTTWTHTIDLNVPDGKPLLLEYAYKASGIKSMHHDILNTCTISGVGESVLEGDSKLEIEVKDATAQADTKGIMLYKVDANSDGVFLENARFNIYIWNDDLKEYIIVHHPDNGNAEFTTDKSGMIVLDGTTIDQEQFAYNTAYYIVEVESPDGYYLGPEPYYFYIENQDIEVYPWCGPPNFRGVGLISGDIIYRQNVSETTEITVEKYWKGYNGENITITGDRVPTVKVELWQRLRGDPESAKLFGTYTITPDEDGNWSYTITGLPRATKNPDGTRGTDYLYYIKEVKVAGYALESSENNAGINEGIIKLVNRKEEGYDLPKTGGAGTQLYTTAGLLLMLTSTAFLVYINKRRRREDMDSS